MIAVGLMSGTSLDGIDAALVQLTPRVRGYDCKLLQFVSEPFEPELATRVREAVAPNEPSPRFVVDLHHDLGSAFARAVRRVAGALRVDYVASHGLTLFHDGARHRTMQIGDPFVLRAALNATVVFDFRSGDCALGGHGAPLVPYVDALLLSDDRDDRVALNLGGIANLTALPAACAPHDVLAFDTGPGTMLIDAFVRERTDGRQTFDRDGAFASGGTVDEPLLNVMLADPYFADAAPKSTGRERFGSQFLRAHDGALRALSIEDGAATLTELTARSVAAAVSHLGMDHARVVYSGGGAHNRWLIDRLRAHLPCATLVPSDTFGLPVDAKEAIAFAIFGYETLRERAANVPRVTGASSAVPLGALAPSGLRELLLEVERECAGL